MNTLIIGGKDYTPYLPKDSAVSSAPAVDLTITEYSTGYNNPEGWPFAAGELAQSLGVVLQNSNTLAYLTLDPDTVWTLLGEGTNVASLSYDTGVGPSNTGVTVVVVGEDYNWPANLSHSVPLSVRATYGGGETTYNFGNLYVLAHDVGYASGAAALAAVNHTVDIGAGGYYRFPQTPMSNINGCVARMRSSSTLPYTALRINTTTAALAPAMSLVAPFRNTEVTIYNAALTQLHQEVVPGAGGPITYTFATAGTYYILFRNTFNGGGTLDFIFDAT